jgi:hypothetical protein
MANNPAHGQRLGRATRNSIRAELAAAAAVALLVLVATLFVTQADDLAARLTVASSCGFGA